LYFFSNYSFLNEINYVSNEVQDLDFNLDNLISASIGLSQMAAEKIVMIKKNSSRKSRCKRRYRTRCRRINYIS